MSEEQMLKKLVTIIGLAGSLLLSQNALAYKVAMVLPGNINDKSWNQSGYTSLVHLKDTYGAEIAYSEKVPQPDQAETLADYARQGYDLVIAHGGEFQGATERVARKFKDTTFLINNGTEAGKNVATLGFSFEQMGYLAGYVAAKQSKSGVIGYIGAQQVLAYVNLMKGYEQGAKAAKSDVKVLVAWTNDWDDIAKGKEAALSQISQGADVVFPTMDNAVVGSLQACKEKGVKGIGIYYDAITDWPDTVIQSVIANLSNALASIMADPINKDELLTGQQYSIGLETPSAAGLGSYAAGISQEIRDAVEQIKADIVAGKITINLE